VLSGLIEKTLDRVVEFGGDLLRGFVLGKMQWFTDVDG
jgi:hypothetical protein